MALVIVSAIVLLGAVGGVGFWKYHEQPEFCGLCHIMDPYLESWEESELLAHDHAEEGTACLDCHEPTFQQQIDEVKVYVQGDFEVPLEERGFGVEFCLDCHLPNEHTSYAEVIQRTEGLELDPHDSHLGDISEMECSICHKVHRASEDYCAQCHGPVATGAGWTTEVSPTMEVAVWTPDMDCTVCHVMDPYVESLEDANLLAYAHAQEGLACLDCHEETELRQVHEEAVAGTPIEERKVEMEFCFDCHLPNEHSNYEQIIERTKGLGEEVGANPHNSHFGEMECRLCHKVHRESEDYCAQCHSWGWEVP